MFYIFFTEKFFSKEAIEIQFLIPVTPQNMLKLHTEKSLNMTQLASLKKIHTKIIIMKRNIQLNDLGCFWLVRIYIGPFSKLFIILPFLTMISPKREIDETVNFRNCRKLFRNKFATFFVSFWHPIFKQEKQNEVTRHMKHAAMVVTCTLGKL